MKKQTIRDTRIGTIAEIQTYTLKEGKYWVVVSPAVRVSGYGKTEEEATESFRVELDMFFEEATQKGSLAQLLINYGWTLSNKFALPPPIDIPVELLSKTNYQLGHRRVAIPV